MLFLSCRGLGGRLIGVFTCYCLVLVGFGLAVPPTIHRILTACGIKDCSATIRGSRNPMQVVKATIGILHGGVSRTPSRPLELNLLC